MSHAIYFDSFSGALGDLPKKLHGNERAVLEVLERHPRFSIWDVTPVLGDTLERLCAAGRVTYDEAESYPWCRVTVLAGSPIPEAREP